MAVARYPFYFGDQPEHMTPLNYRIVDQDPNEDELHFVASFSAPNDDVAMAEVTRFGRTADHLQIYVRGKWQWIRDPRPSAYDQ